MPANIIGYGYTKPCLKSGLSVFSMIKHSVELAFQSTGSSTLSLSHLDGMLAIPSIAEPKFLDAHYIATKMNLFPKKKFFAKTIDTCGASPVSALLEAKMLIEYKNFDLIAVVGGDAVSSISTETFLNRVNVPFIGCTSPSTSGDNNNKSMLPYIPHGYDRIAQWSIDNGYVTREQLVMACVLMSYQASRHPDALTKRPYTLNQVLQSPTISSVTGLLECARRADGGATLLIASSQFIRDHHLDITHCPTILGGGESSSILYPPNTITDEYFNCDIAVEQALYEAKLTRKDIQFYGLYDCFPICLIKAIEAVGLAPKHQGGQWIEAMYHKYQSNHNLLSPTEFPINTHGGLMCFAAPWTVPAMYNIIEAVIQLNQQAQHRQVTNIKNALVYGNGGIFSASAIAILTNNNTNNNN